MLFVFKKIYFLHFSFSSPPQESDRTFLVIQDDYNYTQYYFIYNILLFQ